MIKNEKVVKVRALQNPHETTQLSFRSRNLLEKQTRQGKQTKNQIRLGAKRGQNRESRERRIKQKETSKDKRMTKHRIEHLDMCERNRMRSRKREK